MKNLQVGLMICVLIFGQNIIAENVVDQFYKGQVRLGNGVINHVSSISLLDYAGHAAVGGMLSIIIMPRTTYDIQCCTMLLGMTVAVATPVLDITKILKTRDQDSNISNRTAFITGLATTGAVVGGMTYVAMQAFK